MTTTFATAVASRQIDAGRRRLGANERRRRRRRCTRASENVGASENRESVPFARRRRRRRLARPASIQAASDQILAARIDIAVATAAAAMATAAVAAATMAAPAAVAHTLARSLVISRLPRRRRFGLKFNFGRYRRLDGRSKRRSSRWRRLRRR